LRCRQKSNQESIKKKVLVHHPDFHVDAFHREKRDQEKFRKVEKAYGTLSDPKFPVINLNMKTKTKCE
jgi:DnaJ-class molecular chaperone